MRHPLTETNVVFAVALGIVATLMILSLAALETWKYSSKTDKIRDVGVSIYFGSLVFSGCCVLVTSDPLITFQVHCCPLCP